MDLAQDKREANGHKGGAPDADTGAVMSADSVFGSVLAATTIRSACWPLVMKVFCPDRR